MKRTPFNLSVVLLVAGTASAASHYHLRLDAPQSVAAKELKPGEYKVEMAGDKAVFTAGGPQISGYIVRSRRIENH